LGFYEKCFKEKVLKKTKEYTNSKKNVKLLKEENEDEVKELKAKMDDLCKQIKLKQKNNLSFLDNLGNYLFIKRIFILRKQI